MSILTVDLIYPGLNFLLMTHIMSPSMKLAIVMIYDIYSNFENWWSVIFWWRIIRTNSFLYICVSSYLQCRNEHQNFLFLNSPASSLVFCYERSPPLAATVMRITKEIAVMKSFAFWIGETKACRTNQGGPPLTAIPVQIVDIVAVTEFTAWTCPLKGPVVP